MSELASAELVEVQQGDEYDAEVVAVEQQQVGRGVDPPDEKIALYGTVTGWKDATRQPIVPAWLRNQQQRRIMARIFVGFVGYVIAFHFTRSPKYLVKLALYAPLGLLRGIWKAGHWASAEEGNWALRQHAANRGDADTWLKLDATRRASSAWRWWVVGVPGALAVAAVLVVFFGPATWWIRALVVVAAVPVLAWMGRPADKPITDRVTTGPKFVKLTAEMVRGALCALGVAGIKDPAQIKFPQDIHRDGPGWLARVNLPAGVVAVKVMENREGLSSALRLPVDQVWPAAGPEHAGQLDLWVGYAPASKMGQPDWSLAAENARTSVFEAHEFGTDQRQRPIRTVLFQRNFLLGGVPGSGKSYGARTLAMIALFDPICEMKIAEFKGTGDFSDMAHLCSTYICGVDDNALNAGAALISWGLAEAERRGERIRKAKLRGDAPLGKVTPELAAKAGSGLHPVCIVIDEAHELFLFDKEIAADAERLIKRGRALGIIVILATQIPDAKSVPPNITRCVTVRWCMAVQDQVANDMILGTGAYKRGLSAAVYRPGVDAGWGIAIGLEQEGPVRSHFPDPQTSAAMVARASALRGGVPVGGRDEEQQRRDVLNDVLRVFAWFGRPSIHWQTLAEQLADQMPEAYTAVTAESVSALVRDHGVPSETVKVDGVALKGCKRVTVEAAVARRAISA